MHQWPLFCLVLLLFGVSACTVAQTDSLVALVAAEPAESHLVLSQAGKVAVIDLYSQRGIGRAAIQWVAGDYPTRIILRLHLAGLEQLRLTYGRTSIALSIASMGPLTVRQELSLYSGAQTTEQLTPDSPYWMPTAINGPNVNQQQPIPLKGGWINVELPQHLLQTHPPRFTIEWVDFFR
jgi:hypothetical protein